MSEHGGLELVRQLVVQHGAGWAGVQEHPNNRSALVVVMNLGGGAFVTFEVEDIRSNYAVMTPFTTPETGDRVHYTRRLFETDKGLSDCLALIMTAWKPDELPARAPTEIV